MYKPLSARKAGVMIILGIEFLALIVICYVFFIYATRNPVSKTKRKPAWVVGVTILMLLVFILFASWYLRLGLAA